DHIQLRRWRFVCQPDLSAYWRLRHYLHSGSGNESRLECAWLMPARRRSNSSTQCKIPEVTIASATCALWSGGIFTNAGGAVSWSPFSWRQLALAVIAVT